MHPHPYYLLPLAAAALYPLGGLFLKQAMQRGAGQMRTVFVSNITIAACFALLLPFNHHPPAWSLIGWPLLAGATFFLGQAFTVIALRVGHVSIQAPLMGTKVIFVAAAALFLSPDPIPLKVWIAAAITTAAVFLTGASPRAHFRASLLCVVFSLISCLFFGLTDALVGTRSATFGPIPFVVTMTTCLALLSLIQIPFFKSPLTQIPQPAWSPLLLGSIAIGFQAVLLGIALSFFGKPTEMNVIYSTRGLFGVILVWLVGHLFENTERYTAGAPVMRLRLLGASLLCLAVLLVFT